MFVSKTKTDKMKTIIHTDPQHIASIIASCKICYVGFADTDGTPYVLPMNFGYGDGVIYLHSAQEGRSISILSRNPKICLTFCSEPELVFQHPDIACSYRMHATSVIGWGHVRFEEDFDEKVKALNIIMKQYSGKSFHYSDPAVKNVKIWTVRLEEATCKEFGAPHKVKTVD